MFIYLAVFSLGFIGFFTHLALNKKKLTSARIAELFMLYQLIFTVSLTSFLAFYGLTFMSVYVAEITNWEPCPFTELLGNVNLSYSILGLLCIWMRGNFWWAVVIGQSIWLFADAITHIMDIYKNQNYAPGNAGIPLYMDIFIPILLMTSMTIYEYLKRKDKSHLDSETIHHQL